MGDFQDELRATINRHSLENGSDTPDFVLAKYLTGCLAAFDAATRRRDQWRGANPVTGHAHLAGGPINPEVAAAQEHTTAAQRGRQQLAELRRQLDAPPPYIGAKVLYVSHGSAGGEFRSESRAAVVTAPGAWVDVDCQHDPIRPQPDLGVPPKPEAGDRRTLVQEWRPTAVSLFVMNPGGVYLNPDRPVEYHSGRDDAGQFVGWRGGSWHWPDDEP